MSYVDLFILAIIQGVAEFLPISSSGHLVLMGHWLGVEEARGSLNIVLHVGTLFSILLFYSWQVWRLMREDRRLIPLLIVGTIPALAVGALVKLQLPGLLENEWLAASMLLVTGAILIGTRYVDLGDVDDDDVDDDDIDQKESQTETANDYSQTSYKAASVVGLFQALAILPGISRSGSTIFAGQLMGLNRQAAGTFSFLLAIPVIAGAAFVEAVQMIRLESANQVPLMQLAIGALVSFAVGFLSLVWLVAFIRQGKLHWFAWWCLPFGLLSLLLLGLGY